VKRWGGEVEDYLPIHNFLDSSKAHIGDIRHRALLHNTWGVFLCEKLFGISICNSNGRDVPVRTIAEKHVVEDCGFIPSVSDWLKHLQIPEAWMKRVGIKNPHLNSGEGKNGSDKSKGTGGDNGHQDEEDQAAKSDRFASKISRHGQ
jgi:hypothetical protein|tara:strand:- start:1131 stop:1571 length:441 start_codon:yes stop_codon:yes gene_type:complete